MVYMLNQKMKTKTQDVGKIFYFFLNEENSLLGLLLILLLVDNLGKSHIINVVYDCDIKLAEILFASTNSKIGINSYISYNE